mmetsp:Transcript_17562/g.49885  ORF Transcript_17562/g.49885 Transcript_17562/m.49885 type:complete len:241 (-) Transcript_17562:750-1472(-)
MCAGGRRSLEVDAGQERRGRRAVCADLSQCGHRELLRRPRQGRRGARTLPGHRRASLGRTHVVGLVCRFLPPGGFRGGDKQGAGGPHDLRGDRGQARPGERTARPVGDAAGGRRARGRLEIGGRRLWALPRPRDEARPGCGASAAGICGARERRARGGGPPRAPGQVAVSLPRGSHRGDWVAEYARGGQLEQRCEACGVDRTEGRLDSTGVQAAAHEYQEEWQGGLEECQAGRRPFDHVG